MKSQTYEMLNFEFYKSAGQSLIENPAWKILFAALVSLFHVPVEFIVGLPIFWMLDFWAGLHHSRKKAKEEGRSEWFDEEKMRKQFGKISIHLAVLIGCVVGGNMFGIPHLITFGFAYIVFNEFLFSTIPKFLGKERAGKFIKHIKDITLKHFGMEVIFDDKKQPKEDKN